MLPIHKNLNGLKNDTLKNSKNPGLFFDKFANTWPDNWKVEATEKKMFYKSIIKCLEAEETKSLIKKGLDDSIERRGNILLQQKGKVFRTNTNWRMVSGLGTPHPLEAGFIWHKTLGVPYLPGSSIKGMLRSWAEECCETSDIEKEKVKKEINYLFGDEKDNGAGALIVFDAIPTKCPKLELDIINTHYRPYYDGEVPPADYYSPVPVYFLAVASKEEFEFALAHRKPYSENVEKDIEKGMELLEEALLFMGAGGKTAVGYGQFCKKKESALRTKEEFWENVTLRVTDPGPNELTADEKQGRKAFARGKEASAIMEKLSEKQKLLLKGKKSDGKKRKRKSVTVKKISIESIGDMFKIKDIVEA